MRPWLRSLIPGALQFGALYWMLGALPALQAVLLGMSDLALLGLAITIIVGVVYYLWSKEAGVFWPALLTTFNRVGDRLWPVLTAGLIISFFAVPNISKHKFLFPAWDSNAAKTGAALGAFTCVLYFSELLSSLGFPPGLKLKRRFEVATRFKYMALILAVGTAFPAAATPQFQIVWIPVILSAVIYATFAINFTHRLAKAAFDELPEVDGCVPPPLDGHAPYAIHVTDVHLVSEGAQRIEGGSGGNGRLAKLITTAIKQAPDVFLITGDLTDHGLPSEYEAAKAILTPLQTAAPTTAILLAPGNHDLGTAYSQIDQMLALGSSRFQGGGPEGTNGMLLLRYLEEAARLHPQLKDCNGELLRQRLERDAARDAQFEKTLEETRQRIRANPFDRNPIKELSAAGTKVYPNAEPSAGWGRLLTHPGLFRELYLPSFLAAGWYDAFPLQTKLLNEPTAAFILNSVSPDPTLGGSGWGEIGEAQMERLRSLISTCDAQRLLVLVHHAPFRWRGEPSPKLTWRDLQRWGFLAFGADDLRELLVILKATSESGKEVLVFCGHRHGFKKDFSQADEIPVSQWGICETILVAEGASLADENTAVIAAVKDQGRLELRTIVP